MTDSHITSGERELPSLAPMDRGHQAWSFIAAGFAIEMLLWGGLFSTGVFLKHYSTNEVSVEAINHIKDLTLIIFQIS